MVSPTWRDVPSRPRPVLNGPIRSKAPGIMNGRLHTSHGPPFKGRGGGPGPRGDPSCRRPGDRRHRGRALRAGASLALGQTRKGAATASHRLPGPHQTFPLAARFTPAPPTPKSHKEHLKMTVKLLRFFFFLKRRDLCCCTYTHYLHYKIPEKYLLYQLRSAHLLSLRSSSLWVKHHSNL